MTTVVDPTGTTSAIFNRGGTAMISVSAAGSLPTDATVIPHVSGHTIVLGTATSSDQGFIFDSAFEVGDVVEIYMVSGSTLAEIYPQSGGEIRGNSSGGGLARSNYLRKVSSIDWLFIATA